MASGDGDMKKTDLTVEILKDIRQELRSAGHGCVFARVLGRDGNLRETRGSQAAQHPHDQRLAAEQRQRLVAAKPDAFAAGQHDGAGVAGHHPTRAAKIFRSAGLSRTSSRARAAWPRA